MGKRTTAARDQAATVLAGQFAGTGASPAVELAGAFNISLWGGVATVQIERSFDGGTTWLPCSLDLAPAAIAVTAAGFSCLADEVEAGVLYRLNCTAFTSAVAYRLSQ
jgi:hypothetical protein